jgi:hypothetical protein
LQNSRHFFSGKRNWHCSARINCASGTTGTPSYALTNPTNPDVLVPRRLCRVRSWMTVTTESPPPKKCTVRLTARVASKLGVPCVPPHGLAGFLVPKSCEEAEFHELRSFRIVMSEFLECLVDGLDFFGPVIIDDGQGVVQVQRHTLAAMLALTVPTSTFDKNSPHGLGRWLQRCLADCLRESAGANNRPPVTDPLPRERPSSKRPRCPGSWSGSTGLRQSNNGCRVRPGRAVTLRKRRSWPSFFGLQEVESFDRNVRANTYYSPTV